MHRNKQTCIDESSMILSERRLEIKNDEILNKKKTRSATLMEEVLRHVKQKGLKN